MVLCKHEQCHLEHLGCTRCWYRHFAGSKYRHLNLPKAVLKALWQSRDFSLPFSASLSSWCDLEYYFPISLDELETHVMLLVSYPQHVVPTTHHAPTACPMWKGQAYGAYGLPAFINSGALWSDHQRPYQGSCLMEISTQYS